MTRPEFDMQIARQTDSMTTTVIVIFFAIPYDMKTIVGEISAVVFAKCFASCLEGLDRFQVPLVIGSHSRFDKISSG